MGWKVLFNQRPLKEKRLSAKEAPWKGQDWLGSGENGPLFLHRAWSASGEWRLQLWLDAAIVLDARINSEWERIHQKALVFYFLSCSGAETVLLHRMNLLPLALRGRDALPERFHFETPCRNPSNFFRGGSSQQSAWCTTATEARGCCFSTEVGVSHSMDPIEFWGEREKDSILQ